MPAHRDYKASLAHTLSATRELISLDKLRQMAQELTEPPEVFKRDSDYRRLEDLEARIIDLQLAAIQKSNSDHETRIRALEETATKFNTLLYLTMGGGLVSLFNLFTLAALLFQSTRP